MQEFLDLDVALARLLERTERLPSVEVVGLAESRGRVLADDIMAPVSLPPFPASAMDGYAVRAADVEGDGSQHELVVQGTSFAGRPYEDPLAPGSSVRVFTGAPMPSGADCVILQEDTFEEAGRRYTTEVPAAGKHVRPTGNDVRAGELLIPGGQQLGAFEQAWLSACGVTQVTVIGRPRVCVFATGDELVEPGVPLAKGQIYESNRHVLCELMCGLPVEIQDLGILPDDPDVLRDELRAAAGTADVILTSGGVSVGDADYVRDVVAEIGNLEFWKLALKPGKPLAYGRIGEAAFFGLPGNPVSTIVTFLLIAKPTIQALAGMTPSAPLKVAAELRSPIRHSPGRAEYQRGTLESVDGELVVTSTGDQGSNRIGSFRNANCLIAVPKQADDLAPGDRVEVLPFNGLLD